MGGGLKRDWGGGELIFIPSSKKGGLIRGRGLI